MYKKKHLVKSTLVVSESLILPPRKLEGSYFLRNYNTWGLVGLRENNNLPFLREIVPGF